MQPPCIALAVARNVQVHADAVREAQARVIVFPELSLTGYELTANAVPLDGAALAPIVAACKETGSLTLVGAPVQDDRGRAFIAMLGVDAAGVRLAYRKTWLGGSEPSHFSPGQGPTVLEVDGWRLGWASARTPGRPSTRPVRRPSVSTSTWPDWSTYRRSFRSRRPRAVVIARTCRAYVAFAGFAGPTGDVFTETAGSSAAWSPEGLAVARAGPAAGGSARATLF